MQPIKEDEKGPYSCNGNHSCDDCSNDCCSSSSDRYCCNVNEQGTRSSYKDQLDKKPTRNSFKWAETIFSCLIVKNVC